MKTKTNRYFRGALIALVLLALVAGINSTRAQSGTQVVNFDTLPDGASGVALSNYLAGFGITVSGVTSGVTLQAATNRPGWAFEASSPPAYLIWGGRNDVWQTFTLNFSTPLSSLSFTRCTELPVNGGTAFPAWSATVYQGATVIGTAGEDAYSIWSPNTSPAQTYNFTGTGITSITFSANTWNFAGVGSPAIDNIVMTPAPTAPRVVNFDTLPDGASGVVLSNYLAGFGITVSGVTSGVTLQTATNRLGWAFEASSPPAYLIWGGRNDVWQTFTLNFSTPLSSLSFTRCTELPVNGGTAFPAWSATVYQGATVVGTAGENAYSIWSPNTSPAQTYNFTGTGITSITFSANTWNFAGVGSPAIDDIVITPAATGPAVVNFDTLPDGTSGVELSDYLASFGITTGGVTSGVSLQTQTNRPGWAFQASSPPSYLVWGGRNDVWESFTLNFSAPLSSLSFTRCTELPVNGGTAFPAWSATVYQGATVVGTAGENAYSIWSPNTSPAQTYNFTGTGITSITFSANTWNFAGVGSPAIDDIVMTPVAPVAPTITIQPVSATASSGGTAKFSVGVSGTPMLAYQWALNGTNLVGATHATLTITNLSQVNIGAYTVTVSNPAGSVTSQAATLAAVDTKMFAGVIVDGPLGSNYLIQATPDLLSGWTTLTNVVLTAQPYIFIDYSSPTRSRRFYRAVPQ